MRPNEKLYKKKACKDCSKLGYGNELSDMHTHHKVDWSGWKTWNAIYRDMTEWNYMNIIGIYFIISHSFCQSMDGVTTKINYFPYCNRKFQRAWRTKSKCSNDILRSRKFSLRFICIILQYLTIVSWFRSQN